jgi:hypothetical protein
MRITEEPQTFLVAGKATESAIEIKSVPATTPNVTAIGTRK